MMHSDQIPRLEKFKADHPEIEISSPLVTKSPWWKAWVDGEQIASGHDLRRLLDSLDEKLAEGSGDGGHGIRP